MKEPKKPKELTKALAARVSLTFYERFQRIKTHEDLDDSLFIRAALRLYVEQAERWGIDRHYNVNVAGLKKTARE